MLGSDDRYDDDKQPKSRKKKAIEHEPPIPQPNIKQQSQPLFDNEEQLGHIYR